MPTRRCSTIWLAGLVASACATPAAEPPPADPALAAAITAARADAARRTGRAPAEIGLLGAEAVTWSDGSLGCPQPGRAYTQALVPGFRVRLQGPNGVLDYHADARGHLVLCPGDRAAEPRGGPDRS